MSVRVRVQVFGLECAPIQLAVGVGTMDEDHGGVAEGVGEAVSE